MTLAAARRTGPESAPAPAPDPAPGPAGAGRRVPARGRRGPRLAVGVVAACTVAYALLPAVVRLDEAAPTLPAAAGLEVATWGSEGAWFLRYVHGGQVSVTVPLHNPTALPLTVDAVEPPSQARPLLALVATSGPGTVPPFSTRDVRLTFRYGNCRYYHERAAQTVDRLRVWGHTLGRGFTEEVTLSRPVVVHGQVIVNCPDRTLVRGDDRR